MIVRTGGDRDGNPNVTPAVTLEVSLLSRLSAATLFLTDIRNLRSEISLQSASLELQTLAMGAREPYREVLKRLEGRLEVTIDAVSSALTKDLRKFSEAPLEDSSELLEPLKVIHNSLLEQGFDEVADGQLIDIIRRLEAFGLSLMPLDIRQVDEIFHYQHNYNYNDLFYMITLIDIQIVLAIIVPLKTVNCRNYL